MQKKILTFLSFLSLFFFPSVASAHEAYVLTHAEFQSGLMDFSKNPLAPLLTTQYMQLTIIITLCVVVSYILAVLWATTSWAAYLDKLVKKANVIGPFIIRVAISASFFYAALANSVLGPELSLANIPGGGGIRYILFALALMIFFGFFTEVASLIGLGVFFYITYFFQDYMITYANYFGELLVLFLFGSRVFSLDLWLFGKKLWIAGIEKWRYLEIPIVRILYGVALIYAGWNIKFIHQDLSIAVYNQYHLINFFHANASFIAAGAGVAEIIIGLFILLGLVMRFTILISLIFITLSILYFREMLWPHFLLYGISFSLLINSADQLTIDRYMVPWVRNIRKKLFQR